VDCDNRTDEAHPSSVARVYCGAALGAVLGLLGFCFFDWHGPPVDGGWLTLAVFFGAAVGAGLAILAGRRSISVFWLYLVLFLGGITLLPWRNPGKGHGYYPLGADYIHPPRPGVLWMELVPHLLASLVLALVATGIHRRIARAARGTGVRT
jgi:hypothetical protein